MKNPTFSKVIDLYLKFQIQLQQYSNKSLLRKIEGLKMFSKLKISTIFIILLMSICVFGHLRNLEIDVIEQEEPENQPEESENQQNQTNPDEENQAGENAEENEQEEAEKPKKKVDDYYQQGHDFFGNQGSIEQLMKLVKEYAEKVEDEQFKSLLLKTNVDWDCLSHPDPLSRSKGMCKATYIESAMKTIQIYHRIMQSPDITTLSMMEVIACADNPNVNKCQGGTYEGVYQYVQEYGATWNLIYPFDESAKMGNPGRCNQNKRKFRKNDRFTIQGYQVTQDCKAVLQQLKHGPLSVFFDSNLSLHVPGVIVGYHYQRGFRVRVFDTKNGEFNVRWHQFNDKICQGAVYPILAPKESKKPLFCPRYQLDKDPMTQAQIYFS